MGTTNSTSTGRPIAVNTPNGDSLLASPTRKLNDAANDPSAIDLFHYLALIRRIFDQQPVLHQDTIPSGGSPRGGPEEGLSQSVADFERYSDGLRHVDEKEPRPVMPQAVFSLIDFTEPIHPVLMETTAAILCAIIEEAHTRATTAAAARRPRPQTLPPRPTFVVSAGQRGAGALAQAVALRLGLPFSLSNWYPDGSIGDNRVDRCEGIGGMGWVYLNGVPPNSHVIVTTDILNTGSTVAQLVEGVLRTEGCTVMGVFAIAEVVDFASRKRIAHVAPTVPVYSLVQVSLDGERTHVLEPPSADDFFCAAAQLCKPPRVMPSSTVSLIKKMSAADIQAKFRRVSSTFCGVPIVVNPNVSYPYCFFALTDFKPALEPSLVEDMADLCVYYADFPRCDVLVSEGDRGGGPLLQAISVRTHLPYVLASWSLTVPQSVQSNVTNVGFSGSHSQLSLNGLRSGMRCALVDDMLSSGGTAEAILNCTQLLGASTLEAVFVSEKLYAMEGASLPVRKGKKRLEVAFPEVRLTCVVQFVVEGERTSEPPCRVGE